jgi:hypothetical protein
MRWVMTWGATGHLMPIRDDAWCLLRSSHTVQLAMTAFASSGVRCRTFDPAIVDLAMKFTITYYLLLQPKSHDRCLIE